MTDNSRIPLPLLPRKLREATGELPPSYGRCYQGIVDGRIPAEQDGRGRWVIKANDLPEIARAFGLDPHAVAA